MPNSFDQNRRKFPRADYPCQLTVWRVDASNEVILTHTTNIGAGGVGIMLHQRLLIGTVVDMKIDFTDASIPFKCRGQIMRCLDIDDKTFEVGIAFEGLDEVKQSFLLGKISEILDKDSHGNKA